jgi:hypothetical protein
MGYKILGYLVWRGARFYLRRRMAGGARRKLALAGAAGVAAAGALVAQRAVRASGPGTSGSTSR